MGRGKAAVNFIKHHPLIWLGLLINISFYISAYQTHWFDYFFSGVSLHLCCKGLDFYVVPNGFYSYLHGSNLGGFFSHDASLWCCLLRLPFRLLSITSPTTIFPICWTTLRTQILLDRSR